MQQKFIGVWLGCIAALGWTVGAEEATHSPAPSIIDSNIDRPGLANQGAAEFHLELYTMGQGEILFEKFGHAALCVVDDIKPDRSRCYNYGTTDFNAPPPLMTWQFLRGTSQFWVSKGSLTRMLKFYTQSDRTVYRQVLPFSLEQAKSGRKKLEFDARVENRYYAYHHFRDNCSSRVRDIIDQASGGVLSGAPSQPGNPTFRQMVQSGLAEESWGLAAGTLLVGRAIDQPTTPYERMFLPDVLRLEVGQRLGAVPEVIYERQGRQFSQTANSGREYWALLFALTTAPLLVARAKPSVYPAASRSTGIILGLLGALVWAVVMLSGVPELQLNEALVVFWPTDVVYCLRPSSRIRAYAKVRLVGLLLASLLVALHVFQQPLLIPILLPLLAAALILGAKLPSPAVVSAEAPATNELHRG